MFTRVFGVVSAFLHSQRIRLICYLDDWLILVDSPESVSRALNLVLSSCQTLGVRVNVEKSDLVPSQRSTYLGMIINSVTFRAYPSLERVERFSKLAEEFVSHPYQPASLWESLLGTMASLLQLVQGSRLRMRPLQFSLRHQWPNRRPKFAKLMVRPPVRDAVLWWLEADRLRRGVSLEVRTPSVHLWTDASLAGWGGHTSSWQASGLWDRRERHLHINVLEIRAMMRCLELLPSLEKGSVVALQGDNTTALASS